MHDHNTAPTCGATIPANTRRRAPFGWQPDPDPDVAGLIALALSRAYYAGRGLDGLPVFRIDGTQQVEHLTLSGVRRMLGGSPTRRFPPDLVLRVRASLQTLADELAVEVDALLIERSIVAHGVAVAASEIEQ